MKASKFTDAQKAFIIKQGEDDETLQRVQRRQKPNDLARRRAFRLTSACRIHAWSKRQSAARGSTDAVELPRSGGKHRSLASTHLIEIRR